MSNYSDWTDFGQVYLEDSYVLDIKESGDDLAITMEIVLTEDHPKYQDPFENEVYCYAKAKILFPEMRSIRWIRRNRQPAIDASGDKDFGNIDSFVQENDSYRLSGDWGEVVVESNPVELIWMKD